MTAINAFLRPDRGFLMADSAHYTAAGEPIGFGSKIITLPKLNAAIASRGLSSIVPTLASAMSLRYLDFDDMVERIQPDLVEWAEEQDEYLQSTGFHHFEFHLMGWSQKEGRPRHFIWTNAKDNGDILQCQLYEVSGYVTCPELSDTEAFEALPKLGVFVTNPEFANSFDPQRDGVPIMMAQRREVDELDGHEENGKVCIVGGHIEVTEISAEGISQRVLHRWADQAGVFVQPEALSPRDVLRARVAEKNRRIAEAQRTAA